MKITSLELINRQIGLAGAHRFTANGWDELDWEKVDRVVVCTRADRRLAITLAECFQLTLEVWYYNIPKLPVPDHQPIAIRSVVEGGDLVRECEGNTVMVHEYAQTPSGKRVRVLTRKEDPPLVHVKNVFDGDLLVKKIWFPSDDSPHGMYSTDFSYDENGRLISSLSSFDCYATDFAHGPHGVQCVSQRGVTVAKYTYDAEGRLLSEWTPREQYTVTYEGDKAMVSRQPEVHRLPFQMYEVSYR